MSDETPNWYKVERLIENIYDLGYGSLILLCEIVALIDWAEWAHADKTLARLTPINDPIIHEVLMDVNYYYGSGPEAGEK